MSIKKYTRLIWLAKLVLVLVIVVLCFSTFTNNSKRPHVFLITLDAVGANYLELHNNQPEINSQKVDLMPFLTNLAKQGAVFDNAITVASQSGPGHASILSGRHPAKFGMYKNGIPMSQKIDTLGAVLKQNGYRTYGIPNTVTLSPIATGLQNGFTEYHILGDRHQFSDKYQFKSQLYQGFFNLLNKHLDRYQETPAFFWLHHDFAHHPYHYPKEYSKLFQTESDNKLAKSKTNKMFKKLLLPNAAQVDLLKLRYYRSLRFIDDKLRILFTELEQKNILKNSLIIITADHGETWIPDTVIGHSGIINEDVLRIPLLFIFPDQQHSASRTDELVDQRDIMPTVLHYLGIKVPDGVEGRSLLPMLSGKKVWQEHNVVSVASPLRVYTARNSSYKLIEKAKKEGLQNHREVFPSFKAAAIYRITDKKISLLNADSQHLQAVKDKLEQAIFAIKGSTNQSEQQVSKKVLDLLYKSGYLDPNDTRAAVPK